MNENAKKHAVPLSQQVFLLYTKEKKSLTTLTFALVSGQFEGFLMRSDEQ
jgi:hypothetical protein